MIAVGRELVGARVAWGEISKRQTEHKQRGRKDMGMCRLSLRSGRTAEGQRGLGLRKKWRQYEGAWDLLDG
jgi:hypothetical protein